MQMPVVVVWPIIVLATELQKVGCWEWELLRHFCEETSWPSVWEDLLKLIKASLLYLKLHISGQVIDIIWSYDHIFLCFIDTNLHNQRSRAALHCVLDRVTNPQLLYSQSNCADNPLPGMIRDPMTVTLSESYQNMKIWTIAKLLQKTRSQAKK